MKNEVIENKNETVARAASAKVVANRDHLLRRILDVRGKSIMIDRDLAELYNVPTKRLNEQVKRNAERFPADFMFQLNKKEVLDLKCQIGTSSWGGDRYLPHAFTEQGVAMLSGVTVRLVCRNRGKPTPNEIATFNRQYKSLMVEYSDKFHDRFLIIDNAELHNLGSSINCLGRRVTTYATRDPAEIAKVMKLL